MKNNAFKWVINGNSALAAVCLLVMMAGGNAEAESLSFNRSNWEQSSTGRDWNAKTSPDSIYATNQSSSIVSNFYTLRKSVQECSADGTYIVTLERFSSREWVQQTGAVVFRYQNSTKFYAVAINYYTGVAYFLKNELLAVGNTDAVPTSAKVITTAATQKASYRVEVKITGNTFDIKIDNAEAVRISDTENNPNTSGQVGFGQGANQTGVVFRSADWTGATPPPSTAVPVSGYYAWNKEPGATFVGEGGFWSITDARWSLVNSRDHRIWSNGSNNALFHASPAGTATVSGAVTFGKIAFTTSNYIVAGGTSATLSPFATADGQIEVTGSNTATISAVIAGSRDIEKSGTGTLLLSSGANTYSGKTTVSGGTLRVGTGILSLGARGNIAPAAGDNSAITINSGATLDIQVANGAVDTLYKRVTGTGTLTKTGGTGELVFEGAGSGTGARAKTVGTLNVTTGTLSIATNAGLTVTNTFSLSSGATLKVGLGNTIGSPAVTLTTTSTAGPTLEIVGTLTAGSHILSSGTVATGGYFNTVRAGVALTKTGTGRDAKWYTAAGADTVYVTYTGGVTIVVKPKGDPTPANYTLTVNRAPTAGGSVSVTVGTGAAQNNPTALTVASGTSVTVAATAATTPAPGYTFKNWTAAGGAALPSGLTANTASGTFTMTGNVTITANFEEASTTTFTLTINAADGGTADKTEGTIPNTYNIIAEPDAGYIFSGWTLVTGTATFADLNLANTTITLTDNATVRPNFTLSGGPGQGGPFTLTLPTVAGGSIIPNPMPTAGVYEEGTLVALTAKPDANYVFESWGGDLAGTPAATNPATIIMNGNKTVTAVFKYEGPPIPTDTTFYLTIEVRPTASAGTVTKIYQSGAKTGPSGEGYGLDGKVGLEAKPSSGYEFKGWGGALSGLKNPDTVTMNSDKIVTALFELGDLKKLVKIDSAKYADTCVFNIGFSLEADFEPGSSWYYVYELTRGGVTVAESDPVFVVGTQRSITVRVAVEDMVFDAVYTVSLRVVTADGTALSSSEQMDVEVGEFKVQKVNGIGSSGSVAGSSVALMDNGRFLIDVEVWKSNTNLGKQTVNVAVSAAELPVVEGFVAVSGDYKYAVTPVSFSVAYLTVPLVVGIKVDESKLPSGYGAKDVRLYRYVKGEWEVVFGTEYADGYVTGLGKESVTQDTGAYRLMINTTTPTVKIGNVTFGDASRRTEGYFKNLTGRSAITPGSDKIEVENISITTNVANTAVRVLYGAANVSRAADLKRDTLKTSSGGGKYLEIRADNIEESNASGVLVYLIVDNGSVSDTINISHKVKRTFYTTETRDYVKRWSPLYAKVNLNDETIEKALIAGIFNDEDRAAEGFNGFDDKKYRLFRYLPNARDAGNDGWLEYKENTKQYFNLVNGRLMWLRTGSTTNNFRFNVACTTTTLTDTFAVRDTLKSRRWTDLVLPFDFKVRVRDVVAATIGAEKAEKSDSLYFYAWEQDKDGRFAARRLYLWSGTDDADVEFSGPFTVYNNHSGDVFLRIPPKPAFLYPPKDTTGGQGAKKALAKESAGAGFWYYAINAAVGDVPELASLRLGYYESERIAPAPPTLGSQSAVLLSEDGWYVGDYLTPELSKSGRTFKLRFINGEKQKAAFKFSAAASAGVPERMQLMFIDAVTGEVLGGSGSERSITVAGNSHSDVYAVIGSRDYLNKTAVGPTGAKFAMGGLAVNQAARSVRIKYYVPLAGTDRVEVSVYNLKGRTVWKNTEKVRQSSWNTMEWRARESRGGATAAGLYIIRVRAINVNGKTTAVENRRITFSR